MRWTFFSIQDSALPVHNLIYHSSDTFVLLLILLCSFSSSSTNSRSSGDRARVCSLCAKLPAVPSVKCVPTMRKGSFETDRESAGGRRTEGQTGWLALSVIDSVPVLARHSICMISFTYTAILIQNLHPAFTEGLLAASHLSLNISQETYRQIRTWNKNMAQWVLDCSGRGTGRTACVKTT